MIERNQIKKNIALASSVAGHLPFYPHCTYALSFPVCESCSMVQLCLCRLACIHLRLLIPKWLWATGKQDWLFSLFPVFFPDSIFYCTLHVEKTSHGSMGKISGYGIGPWASGNRGPSAKSVGHISGARFPFQLCLDILRSPGGLQLVYTTGLTS